MYIYFGSFKVLTIIFIDTYDYNTVFKTQITIFTIELMTLNIFKNH